LILLAVTLLLGIMVVRHGSDTGEAASLIRNSFFRLFRRVADGVDHHQQGQR